MRTKKPEIHLGLEGIYMAETSICSVNGLEGKLYYRGYPIEEIAKHSNFEEVCFLLLKGYLPKEKEFSSFKDALAKERDLDPEVLQVITDTAEKGLPMDVLRTAVSLSAIYDPDVKDTSAEANMRKSVRLISRISSIVAAIGRVRDGEEYVKPDKRMGHVENFLYMLNGEKPSEHERRMLDIMFVLHAEHSSNASTFSTIVTGATLSDIYSAITSGIGTLKGPLHGGADEAALRMMRAIGKPENTVKYINDALAGKQRIMGFGHRVYKAYDPRARIIRGYLEELREHASPEVENLTAIALEAEKLMIKKLGKTKGIWPNVDFFSGPVYTHIGIPSSLFTPIFAASRVPGWCAHMLEYWENNRLIRPLEYYNGKFNTKYIPISKR